VLNGGFTEDALLNFDCKRAAMESGGKRRLCDIGTKISLNIFNIMYKKIYGKKHLTKW
jgi:hypothetical protein